MRGREWGGGDTTVNLWLQLLIFHIQFKATCFCNMTGFTGFENLFRPLHSPLLLSVFFPPSTCPPPPCGDNESGNKWRRGVRVIAVIPEPPQRVQEGRKRRPRALMWMDSTGSQPYLSGLGFTTVPYSSLIDLNHPMTIMRPPHPPPHLAHCSCLRRPKEHYSCFSLQCLTVIGLF